MKAQGFWPAVLKRERERCKAGVPTEPREGTLKSHESTENQLGAAC